MSTASVPLPNWINYALLPLINLTLAFLMSGLVVWIIGENPWEALKLRMVNGSHSAIAYLGLMAGWRTVAFSDRRSRKTTRWAAMFTGPRWCRWPATCAAPWPW